MILRVWCATDIGGVGLTISNLRRTVRAKGDCAHRSGPHANRGPFVVVSVILTAFPHGDLWWCCKQHSAHHI